MEGFCGAEDGPSVALLKQWKLSAFLALAGGHTLPGGRHLIFFFLSFLSYNFYF